MEYAKMWVEDERNGCYKTLAYIGLVVLGVAFGFSMGSQRTTEAGPATMYPPSALQSFGVLTEAADTARSQGDTKIAADLDKAAATHRTRMLAWVMAAQQNLPERGTGH
jgi:hypothetical protein